MSYRYKKVVVKVGSNVVTRADGTLDVTRLSSLVDQIALLHKAGIEIILISSGAVAAGKSELTTHKKLDDVSQRQLYSAVGQAKLIDRYYELFREHNISVGQILTTKEDFSTRRHYLNQRNCMQVMLDCGVIPIVNENDTIAVSELMFTDNDELSGLIASMMDMEALFILSNVDGIYDGPPADANTQVIRQVEPGKDLTDYIQQGKSSFGRGGMLTKATIARKIADEGITVYISNGERASILQELLTSPAPLGTCFLPAPIEVSNIKKWMAHSESFTQGALWLNETASELFEKSSTVASILPVGLMRVEGTFKKDDIVRILNNNGDKIGVGKVRYNSEKITTMLGKHGLRAVVHYDYLYIEETYEIN